MSESSPYTDPSTIVAVASPPGSGERGLLRLSGPGAFDLLDAALESPVPRTRGVSMVRLRSTEALGHALPAVLLTMPGPRSFTGEDSAELALPGNPRLLSLVVDGLHAVAQGAGLDLREARAGEFTARAFLRGRIDLSQAEGIAASIAAASDRELEAASALREGRLAVEGSAAATSIADLLALVEAGIDFAEEEDVVAIEASALASGLASIRSSLEDLRGRATGLEAASSSPRVVLAGPPNAGKSSLFNALLGRTRSVESPIAGTTRDAICEPLHLAGDDGEVLLVDLAGLDASDGLLEQEARRVALAEIDRADLVLHCTPVGRPVDSPDAVGTRGEVVQVATMCDLAVESAQHSIATSARTGAGLDALRGEIAVRLATIGDTSGARLAVGARHERGIAEALEALGQVDELLEGVPRGRGPEPAELVAHHLRGALDALATIGGRIEPDEVLGRIYASFCIGK